MRERGTDWGQVRLILGAQRTAARRRLASDPVARALRAIRDLSLAVLVPAAAVVAGRLLRGLAADGSSAAGDGPTLAVDGLHLVYFLVFAVSACSPLLGAGRSGALDRGRLARLPVGPRTLFVASVASVAASAATLGPVLAAGCVMIGYGGAPWLVAWRLLLLAPLTLCAVALGQCLLIAFTRALAARHGRILSALLPIAVLSLALLGLRSAGATSPAEVLRDFGAWRDWTVALPSWWAATAATASGPLDVAPALGLPLLAWWLCLAGGLAEASIAGVLPAPAHSPSALARRSRFGSFLPGPLAATLAKDLRLLAREPALRAVLAPQAALALLPVALVGWAAHAAAGADAAAAAELRRVYPLLPALGYTLVLLEASVLLNLLGLEGRGLAHWLSLPAPRSTLLLGKNLAVLLTLGSANAVLVAGAIVAAGLSADVAAAPAVLGDAALAALEALCALAAALLVADVASVLRPTPLAGHGRGLEALRSAGGAEGGGLVAGALAAVACAAVVSPVLLLFHHPELLGTASRAWLPLTIPLAAAGSAGLAILGARAGGALLARREALVRDRLL